MNYYNEVDPFAAEWLRNLIKAGHIAPGDVDTRSIEDVAPVDLRGYVQCHFFAGVGVWSYALRRAGWPDDRPVWTGSCPCQPFSSAGKGVGFDDERHLWPAFYYLISQCRPPVVFGEQVASKDGLAWLDLVQVDLEAARYATAAADLCAAGVGAPHIRQRLYWVADAVRVGQQGSREVGRPSNQAEDGYRQVHRVVDASSCGGLADACFSQRETDGISSRVDPEYDPTRDSGPLDWVADTNSTRRVARQWDHQTAGYRDSVAANGNYDGLADADGRNASAEGVQRGGQQRQQPEDGGIVHGGRPSPTNGHWRDADWLYCRDGKWRPVEPGTFPLAHGAASRVGRLRAYGNAIVPQVAETFIRAYLEC